MRFIVERAGKPICEILPARPLKFSGADLVDLLRTLQRQMKTIWQL
jgi:hypothetical protein